MVRSQNWRPWVRPTITAVVLVVLTLVAAQKSIAAYGRNVDDARKEKVFVASEQLLIESIWIVAGRHDGVLDDILELEGWAWKTDLGKDVGSHADVQSDVCFSVVARAASRGITAMCESDQASKWQDGQVLRVAAAGKSG